MTIQMNLHNNNYHFNETRLARIVSSESITEAKYMGFFDKTMDFFRGHVKRDAIEALYNGIKDPDIIGRNPIEVLHEFERLSGFANLNDLNHFTVSYNQDNDNDGKWQYTLAIGENNIFISDKLDDDANFSPDLFFIAAAGMFTRNFIKTESKIFSENGFIGYNIQFMSDFSDVRNFISKNITNTDFSSGKFIEIKPHPDNKDIFIAEFESNNEIEFSNLACDLGELRGGNLIYKLENDNYNNLREIALDGYLTPKDPTMHLVCGQMSMGFLEEKIITMHEYALYRPNITEALSNEKVGNTNLLELLNIRSEERKLPDNAHFGRFSTIRGDKNRERV